MTRENKTGKQQKTLSKDSKSPVALGLQKGAQGQTAMQQLEKLAEMVSEVVRDLRDRAMKHEEDGTCALTADGDMQYQDGPLPALAEWMEIYSGILKLLVYHSVKAQSVVEESEASPLPSLEDIMKPVRDEHEAIERHLRFLKWTPPRPSPSPDKAKKKIDPVQAHKLEELALIVKSIFIDRYNKAKRYDEHGNPMLNAGGGLQFELAALPELAKWIDINCGILKPLLQYQSAKVQSGVQEPEGLPLPSPDDNKLASNDEGALARFMRSLEQLDARMAGSGKYSNMKAAGQSEMKDSTGA